MTEQLKAEAYVRKQRPALMELSFGCRVKYGTSYTTVWQVLLAENSKEPNHYNTVDVRGASNYLRDIQSSEIIGHPINLQHYTGCVIDSEKWKAKCLQDQSEDFFNLIMLWEVEDWENFYKKFNDIVSV